MAKVTVSDFIVALADLLEAESRAFRESAALFFEEQRGAFRESAYRSGWTLAFIAAAAVAMTAAAGFFVWGFHGLFVHYLGERAAPFATGALLLAVAALFGAMAKRRGGTP
ncbi:hypothetical protein [Hydrogenimonas sp.]